MEIVWELPLRAEGVEVQLSKRPPVLVRPLREDDEPLLQAAFDAMSPRSRYLRFHQTRRELSGGLLRLLLDIDHDRHRAWIVIEPDTGEAIAFARFIRLADQLEVADVGLSVIDACQGQGLGKLLFELLISTAHEVGVKQLRFEVLAENRPMMALLHQLGAEQNTSLGDARSKVYDLPLAMQHEDSSLAPAGALYEILRWIASSPNPDTE